MENINIIVISWVSWNNNIHILTSRLQLILCDFNTSVWECRWIKARGMEAIFSSDGWLGDGVSVCQLLGWVMRRFQHWYTYRHKTHKTLLLTNTNAEIHAQHGHTYKAVAHADTHLMDLRKDELLGKRRTWWCFKGAKILSENKKNILLGV